MCIRISAAAALRAHVGKLRVAQAADVVDDARPGVQRGPRDRRLVGVDGDGRVQVARDALDQRHDARDLLLHPDRVAAGRGRLAADIEDVGAGVQEFAGELDLRVEAASEGPRR